MTKSIRSKPLTQQEFLLSAMEELGRLQQLDRPMTRDEFCQRLGCPEPTFKKWMLATSNGREMPPTMWAHVREIIAHETLKSGIKKLLA